MTTETVSTELIVIEKSTALQVFTEKDALDPILQKIKAEVEAFVPDVTTAKGRKEIASMAYKIARSKTYIDSKGKELSAEYKEIPKKIDAGRRIAADFLENLQKEVRKPLDEWEAEQARIKAEEEARLEAERLAIQKEADHEAALTENELFDLKKAEEKRLAEEARLKREEEIRKEAAAQATRDAEAKAERERLESARREAEAKIAAEHAEKEKAEAQERARLQAEQAEKDKIEAAAKAERDRIAAEKKAEEDKLAAVEAERKRLEKIEADKEAERIAREADEQHRANIKIQAITGIKALGFSDKAATSIIEAIELGVIPNVKIEF